MRFLLVFACAFSWLELIGAALAHTCQHVGAMSTNEYKELENEMSGGGYLVLMRHSEKGKDRKLTEAGRDYLTRYAATIRDLVVKIDTPRWAATDGYNNRDNRVRKTAELIVGHACASNDGDCRLRAGQANIKTLAGIEKWHGERTKWRERNFFVAVNSTIINQITGSPNDFGCAEVAILKRDDTGGYQCRARFFFGEIGPNAHGPELPDWRSKRLDKPAYDDDPVGHPKSPECYSSRGP